MENGKLVRIIFFIYLLTLVGCSSDLDGYPTAGQAFVVSVSSDGNYAITSGDQLILWDIKNKTKKIISRNENLYSPYFIKNTHLFLWQDLKDIVHVQDINGKEILSFHSFPSYGQVITSDLQHYFASNEDWDIYSIHNNEIKKIHDDFDDGGFIGAQKLLNLILSNDNKLLLTTGYGNDHIPLSVGRSCKDAVKKGYKMGIGNCSLLSGVVLWNVETGQPIYKFYGTDIKTIGTISPDGKYAVIGDEGDSILVWNAQTGKKHLEINWVSRIPSDIDDPILKEHINGVFALKFINNNGDYLRFTTYLRNYALLYNVNNPNIIKWIKLSNYPEPGVNDYSRDEDIDTAPNANILVMAQQDGPGIIVYKYHPDTQTLEKIWAPGANNWHLLRIGLLNFFIASLICYQLIIRDKFIATSIAIAILIILATPYIFFAFHEWGIASGMFGFILAVFMILIASLDYPIIKNLKKTGYRILIKK